MRSRGRYFEALVIYDAPDHDVSKITLLAGETGETVEEALEKLFTLTSTVFSMYCMGTLGNEKGTEKVQLADCGSYFRPNLH